MEERRQRARWKKTRAGIQIRALETREQRGEKASETPRGTLLSLLLIPIPSTQGAAQRGYEKKNFKETSRPIF